MKLSEKQRLFQKAITVLECYAQTVLGYEFTHGDSNRDPRAHGKFGEKKGYAGRWSLHKKRLARDYNLFIDGKYMRKTSDFNKMGEFWLNMQDMPGFEGITFEWGGSPGRNDGNHFSFQHQGKW